MSKRWLNVKQIAELGLLGQGNRARVTKIISDNWDLFDPQFTEGKTRTGNRWIINRDNIEKYNESISKTA